MFLFYLGKFIVLQKSDSVFINSSYILYPQVFFYNFLSRYVLHSEKIYNKSFIIFILIHFIDWFTFFFDCFGLDWFRIIFLIVLVWIGLDYSDVHKSLLTLYTQTVQSWNYFLPGVPIRIVINEFLIQPLSHRINPNLYVFSTKSKLKNVF